MKVNIRKLEIILINNDMTFQDLAKKTELSPNSITKIKQGQEVNLRTLSKVIKALNIKAQDIV